MEECYHGVMFDPKGLNTQVSTQGDWINNDPYQSFSWNNRWIDNIDYKIAGSQPQSPPLWLYDNVTQSNPEYYPIPYAAGILIDQFVSDKISCDAPEFFGLNETTRSIDFGAAVLTNIIYEYDEEDYNYLADEQFYKTSSRNTQILNLNVPSDTLFQNEFNSLTATNIGAYISVYVDIYNEDLSSAIQKLNNINEDNSKESNKTYIMTTYLNNGFRIPNDDLVQQQINNIALEHPFYGGEAVYSARAALNLDIEDQLPLLRKASKNNQEKARNDLVAIPNPANNKCRLLFELEIESSGKLVVFDMFNQLVMTKNIPERTKTLELDTQFLAPGMYKCIVISNDCLLECLLTIIK